MGEKIRVQIFGIKTQRLPSLCGGGCQSKGCSSKKCNSCNGCDTSKQESEKEFSEVYEAYSNLKCFLLTGDVKDYVDMEFIDLEVSDINNYENIKQVIDKGFETPITVIDGITRYYGGISNFLIYKDIKELLE